MRACKRSNYLLKLIDYYLNLPDLFQNAGQKFSVASFLHNQTLISHEGTHLNYMREFISAMKSKEDIENENLEKVKYYDVKESDKS